MFKMLIVASSSCHRLHTTNAPFRISGPETCQALTVMPLIFSTRNTHAYMQAARMAEIEEEVKCQAAAAKGKK